MAGGGLPGGAIFGSSDPHAAYPARDAVTPADITATIYRTLGVDLGTTLRDPLSQPHVLCTGTPIKALVS